MKMKPYSTRSRDSSRRFGVFFLLVLAIGVIVASFNVVKTIGPINVYNSVDPQPYFAINVSLTQQEVTSPELTLKMDIHVIPQPEPITQDTCITDVQIEFFVKRIGDPNPFGFLHASEEWPANDFWVCINRDGETQSNLSSPLTDTLPINLQEFPLYYPYDFVELTVIVSSTGYREENSHEIEKNVKIPVYYGWKISIPERELQEQIVSTPNEVGSFQFEVKAARPFIYRAITPILIFLIFFFIALTPFIKDISAYAQSVFALFFGIWTVRQLLFPYELHGTSLLDALFISFYVCLAFSTLYWLYLNYENIVDTSIENYQPHPVIENSNQEEIKNIISQEEQILVTSPSPNANVQSTDEIRKITKLPKSLPKNRRKHK